MTVGWPWKPFLLTNLYRSLYPWHFSSIYNMTCELCMFLVFFLSSSVKEFQKLSTVLQFHNLFDQNMERVKIATNCRLMIFWWWFQGTLYKDDILFEVFSTRRMASVCSNNPSIHEALVLWSETSKKWAELNSATPRPPTAEADSQQLEWWSIEVEMLRLDSNWDLLSTIWFLPVAHLSASEARLFISTTFL